MDNSSSGHITQRGLKTCGSFPPKTYHGAEAGVAPGFRIQEGSQEEGSEQGPLWDLGRVGWRTKESTTVLSQVLGGGHRGWV